MRCVWLLACLPIMGLPFGGCVMPTTSGSDAAAPSPLKIDSGTGTGPATGTGCGTDPTTGITLCTGTTECPGVTVDPTVFPECGYYIMGDALDLECLCATYLCPMGAPTTCAAVAALLQNTNEGTVCAAVSNNACSQLTGAGGSAGAGGTAGAGTSDSGTTCDTSCESMCAGEPDCIQACGC